ncbi:MAG: TfoX/Sxy family protein [Azoarcus sp.]|jgi:TfoX/Sxy family transcriptional regulator of competence genes|nr:TfoX/Sxy family protein [Azoarcus sp.]
MASSLDFIEYILEQIADVGEVRYRKMFGEYVVYVDDKPLILVCNDTAFVKILPVLDDIMQGAEKDYPYDGARKHYVVDVDDRELVRTVVKALLPVTPLPKSRKKGLFKH